MNIGIDAHTIEKEEKLGAAGNYLASLIKEWREVNPGNHRFILYFKDRIPQDEILESSIFEKKILKTPFGIRNVALFYNFSLPRAAKKDKVDILFLPFYMRPFLCGVKTVTAIHDISFKVHPEWFKLNYLLTIRTLTRLAVKKSRAIITPSQFSKQEIIKCYGVDPNKIFVIYLAPVLKFKTQKDASKLSEVKNKYKISKRYFFYTATIFNRRHVLESIKAFELFLKDRPDYQFLISGKDLTKPKQNIDYLCDQINHRYPDSVVRVKYIADEDLPWLYQGAELFVWPSEYEGFGLPVIEAMASGVPVLTTKASSLREVAGDSAFIVNDPSNCDELYDRMIEAVQNAEVRSAKIRKGIVQAQQFSWAKCAKETLGIIERACT